MGAGGREGQVLAATLRISGCVPSSEDRSPSRCPHARQRRRDDPLPARARVAAYQSEGAGLFHGAPAGSLSRRPDGWASRLRFSASPPLSPSSSSLRATEHWRAGSRAWCRMSAWRLGKARWRAYCRSRRRWASPQYAGSRRPRPSRQSGEPGRFWQNAPEPGRCLCAWVRFHGKSTTRRCQWWMTRARGHLPRGSSTPSRRSTVPPPSRGACGGRGTRPFHSDW